MRNLGPHTCRASRGHMRWRERRKKQERPRAVMHPNMASPRGPRCEVFPGFLPRSRTDHQIIRAARRAVGDRRRGAARSRSALDDTPRFPRGEPTLCAVREAIRQSLEPKACHWPNCDQSGFAQVCGSSFALGKRVGLVSVHCCGRAPGREVRDCDAMACSC